MILETAILTVRPGQSGAFEAAMAEAKPLIAATVCEHVMRLGYAAHNC